MKRILLCLVICYAPVSWGQDDGMSDDWGGWNEVVGEPASNNQPQLDISLDKIEPLVKASFQKSSSEIQPAIFGVGLDGSDEQQLNFLDGSSLMDYPEEQYGNVDRQEDAGDGWIYYLEDGDAFETAEDVDFGVNESEGFDRVEGFDDLVEIDEADDFSVQEPPPLVE